ncbi:MAG: ammonium transporter, partial [Pseudorhodobacter sp.]|nr:ammonium transporter [Pseudorhodobacter sp.]
PLLDRIGIDDVVGAIPVHFGAGLWGTMAVPFYTESAHFGTQLLGFAAVAAFTFVCSGLIWTVLKAWVGLRPSEEDEILGLDKAELGIEAYPEFKV